MLVEPTKAPTMDWVKIAVLASGSGTILESIIEWGIDVSLVVVDRPCKGETLADRHEISLSRCYRGDFSSSFNRMDYTKKVADELQMSGIELIAMAGFGTVLAQPIHDIYGGRILNTHPSLLPAFAGWHAVSEALNYGVRVTGCTIHLATLDVDSGPILAQQAVPVEFGDTEATLHERIKTVERLLYPKTIQEYNAFLDADTEADFFSFQQEYALRTKNL